MIRSVIDKALSLVGQGYIYGAKGQKCSPAFRQQQAEQYPDQAKNILEVGEKWDGVPVWDCAQLTREVANAGGVTIVSGATSQWNKTNWSESGSIGTIPEGKTVFVYRYKDGKMQHTGVALGDGTCVHARGTAYGVVRQNMSEHAWTHWALPEWGENKTVDRYGFVTAEEGSTVRMREAPNKDASVVAKVQVGTKVGITQDSNDWKEIVLPSGQSGWMMAAFIDENRTEKSGVIEIKREDAEKLYQMLGEVLGYGSK